MQYVMHPNGLRTLPYPTLIAPLASVAVNSSPAQQTACRIELFHGATLPQGAVARIRVINNGGTCSIANYGVPADHTHPADSGSITTKPSRGSAEFVAPHARYTPEPGYIGQDDFEYEAFAKGGADRQLRLKVRVKVLVLAP